MLRTIVTALENKKAQEIKVIEISDLTILADHFVIASGTSSTQVKALADEVEFQMAQEGVKPLHTEGYPSGSWIVLDYGSVVVHVFYGETRDFYSLERLWSDGKNIDLKTLTE